MKLLLHAVLALAAPVALAQEPQEHSQHTEPQHGAHEAPDTPTESELSHVPPDPPGRPMGDMANDRMIELMGMDDNAAHSMVLLDQLEWSRSDEEDALNWEAQAWLGDDYNKAWFKSEGEYVEGDRKSRNELLWDRIITRWWNLQAGVRHDLNEGSSRTWAAFGVQGLAPHWFEVEAAAYVGEEGRTAARFSGEFELLFTQRLILQPEIEFDLYGKDDPENGIGAGLSGAEVGLRLRYEPRRELAPYIGVVWSRQFGSTADLARDAGRDVNDVQLVAGLRVWF